MNRYPTIAGTFFLCIVFILIFAGCDPIYKTRLPKFAEDVKAVLIQRIYKAGLLK